MSASGQHLSDQAAQPESTAAEQSCTSTGSLDSDRDALMGRGHSQVPHVGPIRPVGSLMLTAGRSTVVARMLALQRSAGNNAVGRVLARSPTPESLIAGATDMWGANLNEEKLGADLAALLPGDPNTVNKTMWKLSSSDRDDVAVALVEAVPEDAELQKKGAGNLWLFLGLVHWLQEGETENDEARAIERLVRAASASHRRLAQEAWRTDPTITGALSAQGAAYQSHTSGWAAGDLIFDEYSIVMDAMPSSTAPEAYLQEMATDLNKAVNNADFNSVNTFHRRPRGTGGPAVGDIYHIDIWGPDNGSVMLVRSASDHFIFQTVTTKEDGTHPEYGSRQFGFERLQGGAVRWYTRGASRPGAMPGGGTVGRRKQEQGWTAMLRGIAAELVRRGGAERANSFATWNTHRHDYTGSGVLLH